MKVIVRGTPPAEKRYLCKCSTCNSQLEYTGKDIIKISFNQHDGDTHYLGQCPVCKADLVDYAPEEYIDHNDRG